MLTATSLMLFVSSTAQSCSYVCLDIVSKETVRTYFLLPNRYLSILHGLTSYNMIGAPQLL